MVDIKELKSIISEIDHEIIVVNEFKTTKEEVLKIFDQLKIPASNGVRASETFDQYKERENAFLIIVTNIKYGRCLKWDDHMDTLLEFVRLTKEGAGTIIVI